jgi:acetylornithine deacetylase/succinyl-diaminopimelate desuccinylase-like protein
VARPTIRASTPSTSPRWKPRWPNAAASLGANVKLVLEMAEERGSIGLREFIAAHAGELAADALIASDGPRVEPGLPTLATGTRGTFHFDLVIRLREGGVHSGHWGGLTTDPAIILAHALGHHHGPQRQDPGAEVAALGTGWAGCRNPSAAC